MQTVLVRFHTLLILFIILNVTQLLSLILVISNRHPKR